MSAQQSVKDIRIDDFDYPLPDSRIAAHPLAKRDSCRLLVSGADGNIHHRSFTELPFFIPEGSLLVVNETKVINARIEFFKSTGSRIEVFILEPYSPSDYVLAFAQKESCIWNCMIGNLKRWKETPLEKILHIKGYDTPVTLTATLLPLEEGETPSASRKVRFSWDNPDVSFASIVETAGNIPIPPYLKRASEAADLVDYQTVFSRVEGSVAAPTAGLHFTDRIFDALRARDVDTDKVILHVGAGTFQPVKCECIGQHPMHTETIHVDLSTIRDIITALKDGRHIVAVGTTSVRTLESLPYLGYLAMSRSVSDVGAMHVDQWLPYTSDPGAIPTIALLQTLADALEASGLDALTASTAIMIAPGFNWRIVSGVVTNFHQPQSTLLLLVSSFLNGNNDTPPRWRRIYDSALAEGYRFLSYGDACFFSRF